MQVHISALRLGKTFVDEFNVQQVDVALDCRWEFHSVL